MKKRVYRERYYGTAVEEVVPTSKKTRGRKKTTKEAKKQTMKDKIKKALKKNKKGDK